MVLKFGVTERNNGNGSCVELITSPTAEQGMSRL